ncbi:hypothetical protein MFLAVUS_003350, partial [Mucor flavus]
MEADRQYALQRYNNIISTQQYVQTIAAEESNVLFSGYGVPASASTSSAFASTSTSGTPTPAYTTSAPDSTSDTTVDLTAEYVHSNTTPLLPWMFQETNVAFLFEKVQQIARRMTTRNLLHIESSIHELLSLSNILLLCNSQHSSTYIDVFSEELLTKINRQMSVECINSSLDIPDDVYIKFTRLLNDMDTNVL